MPTTPVPAAGPYPPPPAPPDRTPYPTSGGRYTVPGIADVDAAPHRRPAEARALAERIAADPDAYLAVLAMCDVPGVTDCRPAGHARGGSPWAELVKGVDHA